eukprot:NODE_12888_length_1197_cov_10.001869.p1 GENE.NODE_12888_length_1197_cov_10.001869~~NODE_12888_length_1197_cov_10.001869.p1  ORF type:complete len:323 (+),score=-74.52 NODE_12888_length_1197_cov_10.001869:87-1055(+)
MILSDKDLCRMDGKVRDPYLEEMMALSLKTQEDVCRRLSDIDGSPMEYNYEEGSAGNGQYGSKFKVGYIENSRLVEKASFCTSNNWGFFNKETEATAHEENIAKKQMHFSAVGFSMVFHPKRPTIPSTRIHYHLVEREDGYFWFSGGGDITPYRYFPEDFSQFHSVHKKPCDDILGHGWYAKMKKYNDDYFLIPHRKVYRGVGGCFFDDFNESGFQNNYEKKKVFTKESIFNFIKASCEVINEAYTNLYEKRENDTYTDEDVEFMKLLRGRYTEFDLIYDRGIKFGLQTGMPTSVYLLALPDSHWKRNWEEKKKKKKKKKKL